ncbi:DeoR/GlpR family DNA-binding transcription regulator [Micromonospora sp. NPDC005206]|uniref:DeoR/GlpR family DNA-binding transcription regulator n=1 Tax=Micromonospora sp. NPDC005206 TaxID=3157022 RepID=UPI0033A1A484
MSDPIGIAATALDGDMTETPLRYGSAPERRGQILELVSEQGFCTVTELSSALDVSEMTVRRDVGRLAREGKVRRVHGGVTALSTEALNPSDFAVRSAAAREAKRAIAREALRFIRTRATIGIDSGTTVLELAKMLPEGRRLTVATHSLPAMVAMSPLKQVHVFGLGGELHPETQDFAGPATLEAIRDLRIGTLFLAAGGLSPRGVYCESDHEALVKRALIEVSERVVLLADSGKFGSSAMVRVCGLDAVDHAVIDDAISAADAALLVDNGIDLRCASLSDHTPIDDPR